MIRATRRDDAARGTHHDSPGRSAARQWRGAVKTADTNRESSVEDVEIPVGGDAAAVAKPGWAGDARPAPGLQWLVRAIALVVAGVGLIALVALALRFAATHDGLDPARHGGDLVAPLVAALVCVAGLAVLIFRPERGNVRGLAMTAASWAIALLATLIVVWYLIDVNINDVPEMGTPLTSQADVDAFLAANLDPAQYASHPVIAVPTGVLVQSIEFLNANNVEVSGYVWQRYAPTVPADIARGFVLPEAVSEAYAAEEVYRFTESDGSEVIGWYFSATLRQPFDYRHYPFDRQDVWIRLWHRDFSREVVLTPDLGAYTDLDPTTLPGLEQQFVYGGWDPVFSGFSYALNHYNSTLGFGPAAAIDSMPELYFNVGLKRDFLGPFVDHIVLTVAIALLVFAILSLTTSDEERHKRTGGLATSGVILSSSGLLFAVLLEHNQIRSIVASQDVAYIELLPFILYAAILLTALNAVLISSSLDLRFVRYKSNLLPDLLYWPVLLTVLLIGTLVTFY
jgi:hypothetical protein